jgi:DNA-binding PadR family transcriptional regulator
MALSALGVAALGLLFERPMHPYEMYQLLISRSDDRLVKVRPGSLYHAVDRMHEDGLVVALATERQGNRPERTRYQITRDGVAQLQNWERTALAEPANEFPRFPLAISQAHNLPQDEVVGLLSARIHQLGAAVEALDAGTTRITKKDLPERYWLEVTYQRVLLQAELDWLQRTASRIESGDLPWDVTESDPEGVAP